jgi:hypothetical protein
MDDTENRCVCADSQREREHRHGGKAGIFPQHAQAKFQVLPYSFDHRSSRIRNPEWLDFPWRSA